MASKQVNLGKYMNESKKTISNKMKPPKASDDRAHNIKEVMEHKSKISSLNKRGDKVFGSNPETKTTHYTTANGAMIEGDTSGRVKKNPIKKK